MLRQAPFAAVPADIRREERRVGIRGGGEYFPWLAIALA